MYSRAALFSFLAVAPSVFGLAIKRADQPAEIIKPAAHSTIWSPTPYYKDAKGQVDFQFCDPEAGSVEVAVRVSLKDSKGVTNVVADKVNLDDASLGKEASTTLSVCFDTFPDGAYTLVVDELDCNGNVVETITEPIDICATVYPHAPRATDELVITSPASGAVVETPGGWGSFEFSAHDGYQFSQYYVKIYLKDESGKSFYVGTSCFEGYNAYATIDIDTGKTPCGNYELIVKAYENGSDEEYNTISQDICIS